MDTERTECGMVSTARSILGEDYESFANFFLELLAYCIKIEKSGVDSYFFVAFLTRRCHVLLEIFLEIFRTFFVDGIPAGSSFSSIQSMSYLQVKQIVDEHFLTDSNLVTQADRVADFYRENGRFPRVIILDEIILHGRAVNNLLLKYESAVIKRLAQFDPEMNESKRDALRDRLVHLTEVRIYAQNDEPLLLLSRYRRRLHRERLCDSGQIRELSQKFAALILNSDVNNVAYSWNFRIPFHMRNNWKYSLHPKNFAEVHTKMKSIHQTCFFWLYPDASSPKAICTLRWKYSYTSPRSILSVPFIIFDRIPRQNLLRLHKRICEDLRELNLSFLTGYEDYDVGSAGSRYLLWLSETNDLILAYLMFRRFCAADGTYDTWAKYVECSILERNFKLFSPPGRKQGEIAEELKRIWAWEPPCPDQLEQYFEILLEGAQPLWTQEYLNDISGPISVPESGKLLHAVEDVIASIGYEAERNACEKYSSGIFFSDEILADWGKRYSMSETIALCQKLLEKEDRGKLEELYAVLALIVQAMDIGIIGMNPEYETATDTLYTMVRAGEHSLFIKPERYQDYIPVLVEISRRCRESQLDLRRELERYIRCLPKEKSYVTVEELYRFMEDLRQVNQKVENWNFRLFDQINICNSRHCVRAQKALSRHLSAQSYFLQEYKKM